MFNSRESRVFRRLNTPAKIQDFLETLKINFEERGDTCMSPRRVLETGKAHCMEGAMLAACALEFHGHAPLLLDLRAADRDFDHVVALFRSRGRQDQAQGRDRRTGREHSRQGQGYWGAISKTNHAVLRYREPVYRTLRELALSFFHEYFMDDGKKTMYDFSRPMSLRPFEHLNWRTSDKDLWEIPDHLDKIQHYPIVPKVQRRLFRRADPIEIAAGKLTEWQLVKGKTARNKFK